MSQRVAVVVGVGPGNGASLARRFSAEGYAVALLARSTAFSESLVGDLDGPARVYACDVTDEEAIRRTFAAIRADLGEVEALLYNAGSGTFVTPDQATGAQLEQSWRVNTLGLFHCVREVMPAMEAAGDGSILVTGATASLRGKPFTTVFAQAKAAQRSLCESLARHLWPKGVHVALVIVDGMIDLESTRRRMPDKPDSFFIDPDDFAHCVWTLHTQPRSAWSFQVEARPFQESW